MWHYAAGRKKGWKGTPYYEVHEVYKGLGDDGTDGYSNEGIRPGGQSVKELQDDLRMMLRDIQHYGVVDVEEEE